MTKDLSIMDDYPEYQSELGELNNLIGKIFGYDILEDDIIALSSTLGYPDARIIYNGMAITMDYNPKRVNLHLDKYDGIERISVG